MSDIRINGRMVNFSRLIFQSNDPEKITASLEKTLGADQQYQGTLVIIDSTVDNDLISLIQLLVDFGLQPMAAIDGKLGEQARTIQFPVLSPDQPMQRIKATEDDAIAAVVAPVVPAPVQAAPVAAPVAATPPPVIKRISGTKFHHEVLRTGQSLNGEDSDIVLLADMNSGSEIISAGNIHIYGTARGRVIAGASGLQSAHIFCQRLEAELVSIAGTYCVADDIPSERIGKPAHIFLNPNQELVFQPLHI
jgi:septum site-determining protein MinC